ncbi:MAG: hypothetical protein IJ025_08130 [Clostridia bacterium]|nr:hypothetical protein [Clostridia bacterium]
MAKSIKVDIDKVKELSSQIDKQLENLQTCYDNIVKNKQLICDSWQSEAALKYVEKIDKENKNILKLKEAIVDDKNYTITSSENIISIDKTIARKIEATKI